MQTLTQHKALHGVVAHAKPARPRFDPPAAVGSFGDDSKRRLTGQTIAPIYPGHGDRSMQMVAVLMTLLVVGFFTAMAWWAFA